MRIEPEKRLIKYDKEPDVLKISKATTVEAGGLTVTAGGLTVTAGGLTVTAGDLTLTAGSVVQTVPNAVIADPGDAGTITPTSGAVKNICVITTAGAGETRVLGVPEFIGQEIAIHHGTDGGDFAMTNASGWKGGGASDDVATFAEAEDVMVCVAAGTDAVDWRWIADVGVAFA